MGAIKDPASDVAARFLADLRANTTRTADQRTNPAWHAMALASRLAARSPAKIAADRAEIAVVVEALGNPALSPVG
jgi:hypothetical protein